VSSALTGAGLGTGSGSTYHYGSLSNTTSGFHYIRTQVGIVVVSGSSLLATGFIIPTSVNGLCVINPGTNTMYYQNGTSVYTIDLSTTLSYGPFTIPSSINTFMVTSKNVLCLLNNAVVNFLYFSEIAQLLSNLATVSANSFGNKVQFGTGVTNASYTAIVYYPTPYVNTPVVVPVAVGSGLGVSITAYYNTYFTVTSWNDSGGQVPTVTFEWIAIGT